MNTHFIDAPISPLAHIIEQYSEQYHQSLTNEVNNETNFISSPLGAWLLIALVSGANKKGYTTEEQTKLESILHTTIEEAYTLATNLLKSENPEIAVAAGAWVNENTLTENQNNDWFESFDNNEAFEYKKYLPTQEELNLWTKEKTLGIINEFPTRVTPYLELIVATAIATKITWGTVFDVVKNTNTEFTTQNVLRAPVSHFQRLVKNDAGDIFGVHASPSNKHGVTVVSVIGNENMSRQTLLKEAHKIAREYTTNYSNLNVINPLEIELSGNFWETTSHIRTGYNIPDFTYRTTLPAWEAESNLNLNAENLGLNAAARNLAQSINADELAFIQVAKAKFDTNGFEAAAVTAMLMGSVSIPQRVTKKVHSVTIDFNKPYAVIAIATHIKRYRSDVTTFEPQAEWRGIPLFSAFVTEAKEPESKIKNIS